MFAGIVLDDHSIFHAFSTLLFFDIVVWPSRGPVCFLLPSCSCFSASAVLLPPLPHHNFVPIPLIRCSRAGPGDVAVGRPMYASVPLARPVLVIAAPTPLSFSASSMPCSSYPDA